MRGAGEVHDLAYGAGSDADGLEDAQAHGFAEELEEACDAFQLGVGKGGGVFGLTHEYMVIYSKYMNATPSFFNGDERSTGPAHALNGPAGNSAAGAPKGRVEKIRAAELGERLRQGMACRLLDVRSEGEFGSAHVEGAVLQPLAELKVEQWGGGEAEGPLFVLCQSGGRAARAAGMLAEAGVSCAVVEGGMDAWAAAGLPVQRGARQVLPLMRQVQIVIGLVTATGAALAVWKHPLFGLIPLFMGAGLVFAGVTGMCGLALLMARMPWNRQPVAAAGRGGVVRNGGAGSGGSCCS